MTNKEWLFTLSNEQWYDIIFNYLIHDYGRNYIDTRLAIIKWLGEEHKETDCYGRDWNEHWWFSILGSNR